MLDRVAAVELVPQTLIYTVLPYLKEHGFSRNQTLYEYVQDLTAIRRRCVSVLDAAPWEEKAIAVVNCINSTKVHALSTPKISNEATLSCFCLSLKSWRSCTS